MIKKKYDILIVGNLCSLDTLFAEHLSRANLKVCVLRKKTESKCDVITDIDNYFTHFNINNVVYVENVFEFLKFVFQSRLIVSFTGALIGHLKSLFFIKKFLFLPPVVHISTGSDMSEKSVEKSLYGLIYRNYLKYVDMIYAQCYPHILNNIIKLKLKKINFDYSFPFYILDNDNDKRNDELLFFHFSRIDWQQNDNKKDRNSSKGSDRFIRSFMRALDNGLKAKCVILDRGPDRDIAKKWINESKHKEGFIWKAHCAREELIELMKKSDVLVDQFDVGGLGMSSIEGMSLGKPVMMYINNESCRVQYLGNLPPVLNCYSEEEIYEQIMKCQDKNHIDHIGKSAREWVIKNHSPENVMGNFLFHYQRLTGHRIIDYVNQKEIG